MCQVEKHAKGTVKVELTVKEQAELDRRLAEEMLLLVELEARRRAENEAEVKRIARDEEEARRRAKQRAESRRRYEQKQEDRARREEKAWRVREAEKLEASKHAEAVRLRKEAVAEFLDENGFSGVRTAKRTMIKTTFPLQLAAELGDNELVLLLLEEGADPLQRDSKGKTAAQCAQRKDKNGSHAAVLHTLYSHGQATAGSIMRSSSHTPANSKSSSLSQMQPTMPVTPPLSIVHQL